MVWSENLSTVNLTSKKAISLNWDQPVPGEERKLADNQTIAILSRTFLKELKQNKKSFYDGIELVLKDVPKGSEILAGVKKLMRFMQNQQMVVPDIGY